MNLSQLEKKLLAMNLRGYNESLKNYIIHYFIKKLDAMHFNGAYYSKSEEEVRWLEVMRGIGLICLCEKEVSFSKLKTMSNLRVYRATKSGMSLYRAALRKRPHSYI